MPILIKKNVVKRRKGYMYYIDKKGNLWGVKMKQGNPGKKGTYTKRGYYYEQAKRKRKNL